MTLAMANRNGPLRTSQYGFADVKSRFKVSPKRFSRSVRSRSRLSHWRSCQLAEEGKLDLHKPVTTYLPWLKIESKYAPLRLIIYSAILPVFPACRC